MKIKFNEIINKEYIASEAVTAINCTFQENVQSKFNVVFRNIVTEKDLLVATGTIKAMYSRFYRINSERDVTLENCFAQLVNVTSGSLSILHTKSGVNPYNKLSAFNSVQLMNMTVKEFAQSKNGYINAEECILNKVCAKESISLKNCSSRECKSQNGTISIFSENKPQQHDEILAKGKVEVHNIMVQKIIGSTSGAVVASGSMLEKVCAVGKISLLQTVAQSAVIKLSNDNQGLIELKDSSINEDITIMPPAISEGTISTTNHGLNNAVITIKGGVVEGNIIFLNCKGTVELKDNAKIIGQIVFKKSQVKLTSRDPN